MFFETHFYTDLWNVAEDLAKNRGCYDDDERIGTDGESIGDVELNDGELRDVTAPFIPATVSCVRHVCKSLNKYTRFW